MVSCSRRHRIGHAGPLEGSMIVLEQIYKRPCLYMNFHPRVVTFIAKIICFHSIPILLHTMDIRELPQVCSTVGIGRSISNSRTVSELVSRVSPTRIQSYYLQQRFTDYYNKRLSSHIPKDVFSNPLRILCRCHLSFILSEGDISSC